MTDVTQPPPSANCGNTTVEDAFAADRSVTGRVEAKKSPRSLTNVRSAITVTGTEELNVKVPSTGLPLLKGASFRNLAIRRPRGTVGVPAPKVFPFVSVKEKLTTAS